MTPALETQAFTLFLMFCRIGGAVLFTPGLSSPRVPMQIRLLVAVAVTAALAPILLPDLEKPVTRLGENAQAELILTETLIGSAIGLMARFFILALQFAATAMSSFIGLSGIPGVPLEDGDTGSPLATLVSSAAVMVILGLGLHIEMLRALIDSYVVMPPGGPFPIGALMASLVKTLGETWLLALRLAAPFLLYGVIVNFALGMGNRFAQQISMYHATTGAVMLGGFLLLYMIWMDWIPVFIRAYQSWLSEGGF